MKNRTVRSVSLALAIAGATAGFLEGASSRIALSGGPLAPSERPAVLTLAAHTPARPLQPGGMLVLGPTAGPLSAPAFPAPASVPAQSPAPIAPAVDTVTVTAPEPAAPAASPAPVRTWEGYRTGNVVRIDLR